MEAHSKRPRGSDGETSVKGRQKAKSAPASSVKDVADIAQGRLEATMEVNTGDKATKASKKKRQDADAEPSMIVAVSAKKAKRKKKEISKKQRIAMGEDKNEVMKEMHETERVERKERNATRAEVQAEINRQEMVDRGYVDPELVGKDLGNVDDDDYSPSNEQETGSDAEPGGKSNKGAAAKVTERQLVVPRSEKAQTDTKKEKKVLRAAMATHFSTCIPLPALIT